MKIRTLSDLEALRAKDLALLYPPCPRVSLGTATCGLATGAADTYNVLRDEAAARGLDLMLVATGYLGYCQQEPLVDVYVPGFNRAPYARGSPAGLPPVPPGIGPDFRFLP